MNKVIIAGSAKLQDDINYWKEKFSNNNYEVLDFPKAIEKERFMELYPSVHKEFFENITKTDILFIMNEDKNGKEILEILQENYEIETAQDLSGAIKDLFKDALQQMMNAEFDTSMGYSKYDKKTEKNNYRNGTTKKSLKSEFGEFEFETPRDRNGEFEPKIVPKNKRDVSGIEDKIISLYARGLTTREINEQKQNLYFLQICHY